MTSAKIPWLKVFGYSFGLLIIFRTVQFFLYAPTEHVGNVISTACVESSGLRYGDSQKWSLSIQKEQEVLDFEGSGFISCRDFKEGLPQGVTVTITIDHLGIVSGVKSESTELLKHGTQSLVALFAAVAILLIAFAISYGVRKDAKPNK